MSDITELRDQLTDLEVPDRGIEEPLSAPDLFSKKLKRFQDELYNLHQDSHLYRYLLALCGEGGAGSIKKEILYSKLQSTLASTHFHDLDRLYGDPLAFPRIATEIYQFDPKNETLTQAQWVEVYAKDASYRNRCLLWMRAIMYGSQVMGLRLAAEAACGVECDIFAVADYLEDQRSDHPKGIANLGQSTSDGEFVIVPRIASLTQAERHRIISMVDRIRPIDSLVTISLGTAIRTQKFPASTSATSEFSQVLRYVTGRTDIVWPAIGGPASINYITNGSLETTISPWTSASGFWLNSGATSSSITMTNAIHGTHVGKVICDGTSTFQGVYFPNITVIAGQTYTFSVFVKRDVGGTALEIGIGNSASFGGMNSATAPCTAVSTNWARYSVTFTAAVTGLIHCAIRTTASVATTFYFDAAQMEQQLSPTPFIPTDGSVGRRSFTPNQGRWIEPGIEKEAPTYAWISRQEAATFLDITNVTSSSEHYGDFSRTQQQLFEHLSFSTGDQFYVNADDFAYTQAFAQIALSIPWQRNDQVLVNNYYPLEYLQSVDLSQFNVSPTHRFWASREDIAGVEENLVFDLGNNTPPTWNLTGACSNPTPTSITKVGSGGYDSQAYSSEGYTTKVALEWTFPTAASTTLAVGLNSDPSTDPNYASIDYAILQSVGSANIYESGSLIGSIGSCTGSTVFRIDYDGVNVRYYKDGVLQRTVARPVGSALYLDSSFYSGTGTPDVANISFGALTRPVNYIDFEISQKPVDITVETSLNKVTWTPVIPTEGTDYTYGVSYVVSEQPWRFWRLYFDKVDTKYIRISFMRRDDPFPFGNTDPFPWSVDVRNFRAVHLMQSSDDFQYDAGSDILGNAYRNVLSTFVAGQAIDGLTSTFWISQPNPTPVAVEALYFDVSTGTHSVTMSELDSGLGGGGNVMDDYDTLPMSAMESYVGAAGAQVVDEIFIDPVYSGCDMHFYWSTDPSPDWESKLWHPVPSHYKCTRGFHAFPYPVTCRYFKVEFSNLTPVPYNTLDYPQLLPPLYRKFPSWVQNYFSALTPDVLNSFLEQGQTITLDPYDMFKIQKDALATTRDQQVLPVTEELLTDTSEISDLVDEIITAGDETIQLGQEQKIRFFPPTVWQDDLKNVLDLSRAASRLIWQDEVDQFMVEQPAEILDAPTEQSAVDLSAERAQKTAPIMWFPRICRHGYQVVTGPFQAKIAYQVAIREVSFWYRGFIEAGHSEYGVSTYGGAVYG